MKLPTYTIKNLFFELIDSPSIVNDRHGRSKYKGRCPKCMDSKKNKRKTRFYCLENDDHWTVYCHNCNYNTTFEKMLYDYFPEKISYIRNSVIDGLESGDIFSIKKEESKKIVPSDKTHNIIKTFLTYKCIKLTETQQDTSKEKMRLYSLKYMLDRNTPKKYIKQLYFCFKGDFVWRIIIPFYDEKGLLYNFQARDVHPKYKRDTKYLFARFDNYELPNDKIYNQYNVSKNRRVYIFEGIIDSWYVDNSIAICNANTKGEKSEFIRKTYPNRVWVMDSPWLDNTGKEKIIQLLEMGEYCFIMPKEYNVKDINELSIILNKKKISNEFIDNNTYFGKCGLFEVKMMLGI